MLARKEAESKNTDMEDESDEERSNENENLLACLSHKAFSTVPQSVYIRSVLCRKSRVKRLVYCQYGWYSLTFRALPFVRENQDTLTKGQHTKR